MVVVVMVVVVVWWMVLVVVVEVEEVVVLQVSPQNVNVSIYHHPYLTAMFALPSSLHVHTPNCSQMRAHLPS